jgi:hypothetical protein
LISNADHVMHRLLFAGGRSAGRPVRNIPFMMGCADRFEHGVLSGGVRAQCSLGVEVPAIHSTSAVVSHHYFVPWNDVSFSM